MNIKKTKLYKFLYRKTHKIFVKVYKYYTFKKLYPRIYQKYAQKPVDENKVIFIEVRMTEITDSFALMYRELKDNYNYDIHVHYLRMGFIRKLDYMKLCKALVRDMADAKYVFLNDACDVTSCLPMRKETQLIQLWHACGAFKKFGMSTADLLFGDNRKTLEKYPYHGNYSLVTVSAPEVEWAYEEAMSLTEKKGVVKGVGVSRTDVFYDPSVLANAREKLYETFPAAKNKKVILYAPTFRGRVAKATTPNKFDLPSMMEQLGKDYVLLFKHHPFVKKRPAIPEECQSFAMDMTTEMSIEELLCVSDICISDYSSLVFEYSLFEKPMIFFAYDLDNYFDWRGFYYDYKDFVPGPILDTTEAVIDYIQHIDRLFDRQKVVDFRNKFMSACDGHATERIMKLVFGDSLEAHYTGKRQS